MSADQQPPQQPQASTPFSVLKGRIRHHYELCSDYYYSLWGEHIHHGYFLTPTDTKEAAQIRLIDLLWDRSSLVDGSTVLDVGCGIGGTSRYLAKEHGCTVVGLTISGRQVEMARKLTAAAASGDGGGAQGEEGSNDDAAAAGTVRLGNRNGGVRYIELDAEEMGHFFTRPSDRASFDCIWISEAMSHFPDKALFFQNAAVLLNPGGKLVVADWFKAEGLTAEQVEADIKPIEDGMLLPPLCTQARYVELAQSVGLEVFSKPFDISKDVAKTWDISWSLVQSPALWALALSQGKDAIAFLRAFQAMRRGYSNRTFCYAVMVFQK